MEWEIGACVMALLVLTTAIVAPVVVVAVRKHLADEHAANDARADGHSRRHAAVVLLAAAIDDGLASVGSVHRRRPHLPAVHDRLAVAVGHSYLRVHDDDLLRGAVGLRERDGGAELAWGEIGLSHAQAASQATSAARACAKRALRVECEQHRGQPTRKT